MTEFTIEQKRILQTEIPGPKSREMHERRLREVSRGVGAALPVYIERANGAILVDIDGNQLTDLGSGIGVVTIGHTNQQLVDAVSAQVANLTHTLFTVTPYEPYVRVCEILNKHTPGQFEKRSALFNSGAEAVENAVKIARAHTNRSAVIAFRGGFHGRTLLGTTLTGMSQPYKQNFGPFAPEVFHTPYPNAYRGVTSDIALKALDELLATQVAPERVAAIIIEPVQGDGGFLTAPAEFLQALRALADKHGIVLILDEIQTGFGRTGTWFGFQHAGIQPDLVTVAKSLAGGMPLSGVVGRAEIMDASHAGGLGGTFGGSPTATAAGVAVLEQIEEGGWLERALEIETVLMSRLSELKSQYPVIGDLRGKGAMIAIELVEPGTKTPNSAAVDALVKHCHQNGVLILNAGTYNNVIRFLPPLAITDELLNDAMDVLAAGLAKL